MNKQTGDVAGSVQSVERAIDILRAFSVHKQVISLKELSTITGLNKVTAYRIVSTLKGRGFISQDPATKTYSLGSEILVLAAVKSRQLGLVELAVPVVRKIRDATNETASLAVRMNDSRLNLYQLESLQAVRRGAYSGEPSPLYAGASKLLLAAMSDREIASYLKRTELVPFTDFTVVDKEKIWEQILEIRQQGYSESVQERFLGAASLSVPVRDASSNIVGALYVSIPVDRYDDELRAHVLAALRAGAQELSEELGYRFPGDAGAT